jgi:hypothetical protein
MDVQMRSALMRIATMIAAATVGALAAMVAASAWAETKEYWSLQPKAAFVDAYVFACQPVEYDFAGVRDPLKGMALKVYEQLFLGEYHDSCRDFYFEEVVPRLDPDLRPQLFPG